MADRAVSTADALALRSSGGAKRRSIREAADIGLTTPAAAGAFIRCSSHLARGPTSSGGHFSPLRLGAAELGDAARVADNALSDSRLCVEWLETQAATAGSLARPATALADDPANYAREAAMQLKWCAKQAPVAARALRERVRNPGAKCEMARGGGAGSPRRGTRKGLARHGAAGVAVGGLCAVAVAAGRAQLAVAVTACERIGARLSVSV